MKKLFIIVCLLTTTSLICFSQSDSYYAIRMDRLNKVAAVLSYGMLYNTYRVIGSNCDGLIGNIYTVADVNERMKYEMDLINILLKHMTNLVNIEQNGENIYYYNTFIQGFNGLYKQAQLLLDYAANKTKEKMDAFIVQRNINFADIKKLEGELFTKK